MQRNLYLLLFFSLCTGVISAQKKSPPNFTLTGTFSGKHTHMLSLYYRDESGRRIRHDAHIKNGKFSLSGFISSPVYADILSSKEPDPHRDVSNTIGIFISPGNMSIALQEDDFEHALLTGSPTEDEWIKLQTLYHPMNNIKDTLYDAMFKIDRAGHTDSSLAARWVLAEKIDSCNRQIDQIDSNYIVSHPQSYLSAWLLDNFSQMDMQLHSLERLYNAFPEPVKASASGRAVSREIANRKRDVYDETYYSPGGTYSDWYFPTDKDYQSLEWTFVPVVDPPESLAKDSLLHYYAYNFALVNASSAVGGGYAGFQTNGIFQDRSQGKLINFSIWGSNGGKTTGLLNKANTESGGVQIMYKYNWTVRHKYYFELKPGPSGTDSLGKWWGLWVTDKNTGIKTFVGEQRVPAWINGQPATAWSEHTSMFGEDCHWWHSLEGEIKYTDCSEFQGSSMAAIDITANGGTVKPLRFVNMVNSGQPVTGSNGFKSVNCTVSLYQDSTNFNVQHNLGYWPKPAPNIITPSQRPGQRFNASPSPAQHTSK